jgi:hypothetical protein
LHDFHFESFLSVEICPDKNLTGYNLAKKAAGIFAGEKLYNVFIWWIFLGGFCRSKKQKSKKEFFF